MDTHASQTTEQNLASFGGSAGVGRDKLRMKDKQRQFWDANIIPVVPRGRSSSLSCKVRHPSPVHRNWLLGCAGQMRLVAAQKPPILRSLRTNRLIKEVALKASVNQPHVTTGGRQGIAPAHAHAGINTSRTNKASRQTKIIKPYLQLSLSVRRTLGAAESGLGANDICAALTASGYSQDHSSPGPVGN